MLIRTLFRRPVVAPLALVAIAAMAAPGSAAEINVTGARITGGKLVISGTTAAPNTAVRLDGQAGADFNVRSGRDKKFRFSAVYHPGDCIVTLESASGTTDLVVADCGPSGISPRGAWSGSAPYAANDLVMHQGSSWLAKRRNINRQPSAGADWELFAAKGDPGPEGPAGDAGAAGASGAPGADGSTSLAGTRASPTGPAGGALHGTYPNPQIKNDAVRSSDVRDDTLAGGGLAAVDLAANSVGSSEIQTDAVQASEIQDNAIDSGEIVDNSLFAADLGAGAVRASELGPITQRSAVSATIAGGGNGSVTASCLAGERLIAGGNDGFFDVFVVASRQSGNGWAVFGHNNSGSNRTITAHAYCLNL